ncbi:MAG: B12-binding domain-containing radical SAM protein [Promethearchaeota archaeon]
MEKGRSKNVLLLHAPFNEYSFGKRWKANKSLAPPLGLLYLGAPLLREGYNVTFLDLNVDKLSRKEFLKIITVQDFILITCYTLVLNNVQKIIKDIQEVNPKGFILCGGPHCNITHKYIEGSFLTCLGEAEGYITHILNSIVQKTSLEDIPGLIYKKDGKIIKNPGVMQVKNLDSSIFPAWELIDKKKYGYLGNARLNLAWLMSTRGCPFNCHFCARMIYSQYRARSVDNVVNEIKCLVKQGYRYIAFGDDNFLLNKKRVHKIMDRIIGEKIKIKMAVQGRVDSVDFNLFQKMRKAGVIAVFFGIESANQDVLDFYNKRTTVEQGINAIKLANKAGLITVGFFIIGAPFETEKHIKQNLEYFDTVPLDLISCYDLTYVVGTQLWINAVKKGVIDESELFVRADKRLSNYSSEEISGIKNSFTKYFYKNPRRLLRIQYKALQLGEPGLIFKGLLNVGAILSKMRGSSTY